LKNISIIGGGLSGVLLSINLLKQATKNKFSVTIIDRNTENYLGAAYSVNAESLLLNVPACRMGHSLMTHLIF
jgi:uncharacterized NAD(P)/FAD-binding protein YdhS